jgi:hypothetical protein
VLPKGDGQRGGRAEFQTVVDFVKCIITMFKPRLSNGNDFHVMVRNLWRLLASGLTLEEARPLVLAKAGVSSFPHPPAARRSRVTFDTIETRTATVH